MIAFYYSVSEKLLTVCGNFGKYPLERCMQAIIKVLTEPALTLALTNTFRVNAAYYFRYQEYIKHMKHILVIDLTELNDTTATEPLQKAFFEALDNVELVFIVNHIISAD